MGARGGSKERPSESVTNRMARAPPCTSMHLHAPPCTSMHLHAPPCDAYPWTSIFHPRIPCPIHTFRWQSLRPWASTHLLSCVTEPLRTAPPRPLGAMCGRGTPSVLFVSCMLSGHVTHVWARSICGQSFKVTNW